MQAPTPVRLHAEHEVEHACDDQRANQRLIAAEPEARIGINASDERCECEEMKHEVDPAKHLLAVTRSPGQANDRIKRPGHQHSKPLRGWRRAVHDRAMHRVAKIGPRDQHAVIKGAGGDDRREYSEQHPRRPLPMTPDHAVAAVGLASYKYDSASANSTG